MKIMQVLKSKTILFNAIVALGTVLESNFEFIKGQNPDYYIYIVMATTFINFYLRSITTESLKDK